MTHPMNAARLLLRPWFTAGLILLAATPSRADDTPKPDSTLDIIQYKTPAGWKVAEQGGQANANRVLTSPDSNGAQQAIILVVLSAPLDRVSFRDSFETAVKGLMGGGKVVDAGETASTKTRQGYEALARTIVTEGSPGVHAKMVAANVQGRLAGFYFLATSEELYTKHEEDMNALLQSVAFKAGAANPPAAAKAELEALQKERQELLKRLAQNEARQRELGAVAAGAAPPENTGAAPPEDGEKLLALARERFAKEVAGRRKPHTILGDILMLDGKPIPNVVKYRVTVWGTTIAAEKTRYGLDVDANGHFELQVPDGLYQVDAKCLVKLADHLVPVNLVWLDDKRVGVDQASSAGIVRDFRLMMRGLKPGEDPKGDYAYYGGSLSVNGPQYDLTRGHLSTRFPGTKVQVVLVPQGLLVDGSQGGTITTDLDVEQTNYSTLLRSIPIGVYQATATLIKKDGSKLPLGIIQEGKTISSIGVFWEGNEDQLGIPRIYLTD